MMLIFDGDYPMTTAFDLKRDLTLPIAEIQAKEAGGDNIAICSLPEMRRGRVAVALVKISARVYREGDPLPGYLAQYMAYAVAQGHLAYYRALAKMGQAHILTTRQALADHVAEWEQAKSAAPLPVGFILGLEGADPITSPAQVQEWWEAGLRVVSLTHYGRSAYAHGTGTRGPLTALAKPLLQEMERVGMMLDLTHIADEAFWPAMDAFNGSVLASHQNCRALVPGERQFTDHQLLAIIKRRGVIGTSLDTWMLHAESGGRDWHAVLQWPKRRDVFPRSAVTLETVADHIDHVCQLAGNANHAAIGGDTDGQGGLDGMPDGIQTVADYQKIGDVLARRGYTPDDVANVLYRNWTRFYTQGLPG